MRKDFAIVLQHCEKVVQWFSRIARGAILQWFVPDVSNIAESQIFSIARAARGVCNCFAALQKGVAMVLLHCGGFLQWLCFAALRGVLVMLLLRFLIAKGCHKGFAALRGVSAMAPVNVTYCNDAWAKHGLTGSSIFSTGTQVIKCFGVWHSPCLKLGGFVTDCV